MKHLSLINFKLLLVSITLLNALQSRSNDSLRITNYFSEALQNIKSQRSYTNAITAAFKLAKTKSLEDTYLIQISKFYFLIGNLDSANYYANYAISQYKNDTLNPLLAKFYNIKASIYATQNDFISSIEYFKKSIVILEKDGNVKVASQIKNNLANMFFTTGNFKLSYQYSKEALAGLLATNDTLYTSGVCAIVAISCIKLDSLPQAKFYLNKTKDLLDKRQSSLGTILYLYASGDYNSATKNYPLAIQQYSTSLQISQNLKQMPYVLINQIALSSAYSELGNYSKGLYHGLKAKELTNKNTTFAIFKNLATCYKGLNKPDSAYYYINLALETYKSYANKEVSSITAALLLKYEYEKKNKELAQNEIKIQKQENNLIKKNNLILILIIIVASIALVLIIIISYNKLNIQKINKANQQNLFEVAIISEEKERERISNELHDDLASNITGLKLNIPIFLATKNEQQLVAAIESLQNKVRKIAHDLMPLDSANYNLPNLINDYIQLLNSSNFKVHFFQQKEDYNVVNKLVTKTLFLITQELIQNVIKHSQSPVVFINLSLADQHITLTLEDEGIGFNSDETTTHQGLKSIQKRIKNLNGSFILQSQLNKGTFIEIKLKIDF